MSARRGLARLLALLRRRRLERELAGEIEAHLEMAARDAERDGLTPEEARLAARRAFGGIEPMKELHRERRSAQWLDTFLRDLRYGVSGLWHNPGFTAIAVAVLALGIGANTAMFSLVDALFLKPLPFPHPERIVRVWEAPQPGGFNSINTMDLLDWRRMAKSFEALSAERVASAALTGAGEPVRLPVKLVSADYFEVFGVGMQLGRTFREDDTEQGAAPTVVLSHATWQAVFGGDPGILERRVMLDGEPTQVVGVLAPGPFDRDTTAMWKALVIKPEQMNRSFHWLAAVGRLKEGVSLEQAQQELTAVDRQLSDLSPAWKREWGVGVLPFDAGLVGDSLRRAIYVAFGAVAMVLLIACANVANLLLARGVTRKREMALRAALGAGRGRLMRQLLTETLVLCLAGAVAGIAVSYGLLWAMPVLLGQSLPFTAQLQLDPRALLFAGAVALTVTLLVGLLPSIQTSLANLSQAINQGARGTAGSLEVVRKTIVAGEVALSVVLVCGALLLVKSLVQLQHVDPGVRTENVLTTSVTLPLASYPTAEKAAAFYDAFSDRLRAIPGVETVSISTDLPMMGVRQGMGLRFPGNEGGVSIRYKRVDGHYFRLLGIPILTGRPIGPADRKSAVPVVVLNETTAAEIRKQTGIENPVGQTVLISTPNYLNSSGEELPVEVIGVARNERTSRLEDEEPNVVYVALAQTPRPEVSVLLRTQVAPAGVLRSVQEALRQTDPTLALGEARTLEQIHGLALSGARQPATAIGIFGAVTVLLAALGIYGVVSHTVTQRRREIGIRMAMGARPLDVISHVLRGGMTVVLLGLVAGLGGAFGLTRLIESLLFQVSPLDPLAIGEASAGVAVLGLLAMLVPAVRAAATSPVTVLREEG